MIEYGSASTGFSMTRKGELMPHEEKLEVQKKRKELVIGIPAETEKDENRIALTPLAVDLLVNNGHQVIIEGNAGKAANFQDTDYSECGALIVYNKEEIYKSDMVIKVAPFTLEEINMMPGKQTIISALHLSTQTKEFINRLMQKRITAIAYEYIKDQYNTYPVVRSMNEISGATSILIAAEYLSNAHKGKGEMLGGVTGIAPTEVVIIGSSTAAESAAKTAIGLGARVKIFDTSIHHLRELKRNLGQSVYTSIFQPRVLSKALKTADVVIGALHMVDTVPNCYVTEDMVQGMKKNSVIIDVSIDYGGCFETSKLTSHSNPIFKKHGVIHYCVPNIASRVARTASYAISNIITPIILGFGTSGGTKQVIKEDIGIRHGAYVYEGILINKYIGEKFDIPAKDIDLILSAF